MKKRKPRILVSLLLILALSLAAPAISAAAGGLFSDLDETAGGAGLSMLKYRDNYYLDSAKISFFKDPLSVMFLGLANLLFAFLKSIASLQIQLLEFALQTDIFSMLEGFLTPFFNGMKRFVFDGLSLILISLCGAFFMIRLIQSQTAQVVTGVVQLILVIALAFAFYAYPMRALSAVNDVTKDISSAVMDAPYASLGGAEGAGAEVKAKALCWNLMVHRPWQILEFPSMAEARAHEDALLRLEPGSQAREDYIEKHARGALFSNASAYQSERVVGALLLLLLQLIIFAVLSFLCVMIAGYQFFMLLLAFLGIFVFLLALLPVFGLELLKRWGIRILSACSAKILLTFLLAVLFAVMDFLHSLSDSRGLLSVMFLIIVILLIAVVKRGEIFSLFANYGGTAAKPLVTALRRAADGGGAPYSRFADGHADYSLRGAVREQRGMQGVRSARLEAQRHRRRGFSADSWDEAEYDKESGSWLSQKERKNPRPPGGAEGAGSGQTGGSESGGRAPQGAGSGGRMPGRIVSDVGRIARGMEEMSRQYKKAEELLQKNYELSKEKSEDRAANSGTAPAYTDFVRRTNAVRELGAGKFDPRDVAKTAAIVRRTEESGGDPDLLLGGGQEAPAPPRRPASLKEAAVRAREEGRPEGEGAAGGEARGLSGLAYFRGNFGDEAGERFYQDMSEKHGREAVDAFTSEERLSYAQAQRELAKESAVLAGRGDGAGEQKTEAVRAGQGVDSPPYPGSAPEPSHQGPAQGAGAGEQKAEAVRGGEGGALPAPPGAAPKEARQEQARDAGTKAARENGAAWAGQGGGLSPYPGSAPAAPRPEQIRDTGAGDQEAEAPAPAFRPGQVRETGGEGPAAKAAPTGAASSGGSKPQSGEHKGARQTSHGAGQAAATQAPRQKEGRPPQSAAASGPQTLLREDPYANADLYSARRAAGESRPTPAAPEGARRKENQAAPQSRGRVPRPGKAALAPGPAPKSAKAAGRKDPAGEAPEKQAPAPALVIREKRED